MYENIPIYIENTRRENTNVDFKDALLISKPIQPGGIPEKRNQGNKSVHPNPINKRKGCVPITRQTS